MPYADYQKHLQANRARAQTPEGKAAHNRATAAYRQRRRDRLRAHNAVAKAIARGKLTPWPTCAVPECCVKPQAHHPDYSSPLSVVWLCDGHHKDAHRVSQPA